jgi:hypothetical protein
MPDQCAFFFLEYESSLIIVLKTNRNFDPFTFNLILRGLKFEIKRS